MKLTVFIGALPFTSRFYSFPLFFVYISLFSLFLSPLSLHLYFLSFHSSLSVTSFFLSFILYFYSPRHPAFYFSDTTPHLVVILFFSVYRFILAFSPNFFLSFFLLLYSTLSSLPLLPSLFLSYTHSLFFSFFFSLSLFPSLTILCLSYMS